MVLTSGADARVEAGWARASHKAAKNCNGDVVDLACVSGTISLYWTFHIFVTEFRVITCGLNSIPVLSEVVGHVIKQASEMTAGPIMVSLTSMCLGSWRLGSLLARR